MYPCGNAIDRGAHTVGECETYKEEWDVLEKEMRKIEDCGLEKFGTLARQVWQQTHSNITQQPRVCNPSVATDNFHSSVEPYIHKLKCIFNIGVAGKTIGETTATVTAHKTLRITTHQIVEAEIPTLASTNTTKRQANVATVAVTLPFNPIRMMLEATARQLSIV